MLSKLTNNTINIWKQVHEQQTCCQAPENTTQASTAFRHDAHLAVTDSNWDKTLLAKCNE